MDSVENLDTEIEKLREQKEQIKARLRKSQLSGLLQRSEIGFERKVKVFNKLRDQLMEDFTHLSENGYYPKDDKYWVWETAVSGIFGNEVFEILREWQE